MPTIDDKPTPSLSPSLVAGSEAPQSAWSDTYNYAWKGANFSVCAAITTFCILAVQSPAKTFLLNASPSNISGGVLGAFGYYYRGTSAAVGGSAIRTAWNTNARPAVETLARDSAFAGEGTFATEGAQAGERAFAGDGAVIGDGLIAFAGAKVIEPEDGLAKLVNVGLMSVGELLLTNYSESLSTLRKIDGLIPDGFKPTTVHNASRLILGGFVPRLASGTINMGALCLLEPEITTSLSLIDNKTQKRFIAGVLSGVIGGVCSYPFALFKDYVQVQTTVLDGKLHNKSTISAAFALYQTFKKDPHFALKLFAQTSARQLPVRLGLTGLIFGIINGVGESLGSEPLKSVVPEKFHPRPSCGFFTQWAPMSRPEEPSKNAELR